MKKDLPKAIKEFRKLHELKLSEGLQSYLALLSSPRAHSQEVFIDGIRRFIQIANMSYSERAAFFGSQFSGLHYNNDLAKKWNGQSAETIKAFQLNFICSAGWDYQNEGGYSVLVYKGDDLCGALDKLLQGPTVIDCGMFCQLSIWFGIRYMLGNDIFNALFGRTSFYLTQLLYSSAPGPMEPYLGNPLFPFFYESPDLSNSEGVSVSHVHNHTLYQMKHPGGNYGGDNCVVINGKYTVFDPTLVNKADLTRQEVQQLLLDCFNANPDENDMAKLQLYREKNPNEVHANLALTYGQLVEFAEQSSEMHVDSLEVDESKALNLTFNFELFCDWVSRMKYTKVDEVDYQPLSSQEIKTLPELERQIPYENRASMTFATFKLETRLQQELYGISTKFCHDVMNQQSVCVVLTGKAGIGKTASAVSCAKELSSRGRHVIWISEVMVRGWVDQAKSMADLDSCRSEIQKLLATDPDAVFLDDDNLVGYSGKVLLEEIYKWYVSYPGKGLFITSNENISFQSCYGLQLDEKYYFPPFPGYTSDQYTNTVLCLDLTGESLRASPTRHIMSLTDEEKVHMLTQYRRGESVGIILGEPVYTEKRHVLGAIEFVPAFPSGIFVPMTQSLMIGNDLGPTFDTLTPEQKRYTRRFPVTKEKWRDGMAINTGIYWYDGINYRPFDKTKCDMIIVELIDHRHWSGKDIINEDCLAQLLRVINYAHDCGGKKVIILNNTKFSHGDMLEKIKEGIPDREKERTLARIDSLLFSPNLVSSEKQIEFEGVIALNNHVVSTNVSRDILVDFYAFMQSFLGMALRFLTENSGDLPARNHIPMIEYTQNIDALSENESHENQQQAICNFTQTERYALFRLDSHLLAQMHREFLIENRHYIHPKFKRLMINSLG